VATLLARREMEYSLVLESSFGIAVCEYHYGPVRVKARVSFINIRGQVWYGKENGVLETRRK